MLDTPSKILTHVREAAAQVAAQGLDRLVAAVEEALAAAWLLERRGLFEPKRIPGFVRNVETLLQKIAPPPPKKVKFSDPLRKILPLAETSVRPALDAAMLLIALEQAGDTTEVPDKALFKHELFLDDWRRMTWESARITDWKRCREIAPAEERVLEGRLSRDAAFQVLQAIQSRRADNINSIPDLAMLACARCGQFRGRDRVRCAHCKGTFCTRCLGPTPETCLADYSARYASIDPGRRQKIRTDARNILKTYRLDPHTRNDNFARALHEEGVDVIFVDGAPIEGQESESSQGRRKLTIRNREGPAAKRGLLGALGRCYFRAAGADADALAEDFFVDVCLGFDVEQAPVAR